MHGTCNDGTLDACMVQILMNSLLALMGLGGAEGPWGVTPGGAGGGGGGDPVREVAGLGGARPNQAPHLTPLQNMPATYKCGRVGQL